MVCQTTFTLADKLEKRLLEAWPRLAKFFDDSVIYISSFACQFLLSVYLFSLHPVPGCVVRSETTLNGESSARRLTLDAIDCDESPAATQAMFAIGLIVVGALIVGVVCDENRSKAVAAILPKMIGMSVGWAAGDAFKKWLSETSIALTGCTGGLTEWESGTCERGIWLALLNATLSLCGMAVCAVVILAIKPCTHHIELGEAPWQNALENSFMMVPPDQSNSAVGFGP